MIDRQIPIVRDGTWRPWTDTLIITSHGDVLGSSQTGANRVRVSPAHFDLSSCPTHLRGGRAGYSGNVVRSCDVHNTTRGLAMTVAG